MVENLADLVLPIEVVNSGADFATSMTTASVPPKQSMPVPIAFHPAGEGASKGQLTLKLADGAGQVQVELFGEGAVKERWRVSRERSTLARSASESRRSLMTRYISRISWTLPCRFRSRPTARISVRALPRLPYPPAGSFGTRRVLPIS